MFLQQQQLQNKYNSFYAHLDILESQQMCSDLDNLQYILNSRNQQLHCDLYCLLDPQKHHETPNSRVSEIPTVYLVTSIKTQHLPEFQFWTKQNCLSGNKQNNIQYSNKKNFINKQQENEWKASAYTSESFKLSQRSSQNQQEHNYQHKQKKFTDKDRKKLFGFHSEQNQWKTDFIILKQQKSQSKNKNQNHKMMHKCYKIQQKTQNFIYLNDNITNHTINVSNNIMNVFNENNFTHLIKMEQETSEKSYYSQSSNSFSIKSKNLNMISSRILQMNQNLLKKQQTPYHKPKPITKRKRTHDLFQESTKRKYSQGCLAFHEKIQQQQNMASQSNLGPQIKKNPNKYLNPYATNEIYQNNYFFNST